MNKKELLEIVADHIDFVINDGIELLVKPDGVYAVCADGLVKITRKAKAAMR